MQLYVSHALLVDLHGFLKALEHGLAVLGGFDDLLGGVDDALREVRGVRDDPLGAGSPGREEQAKGENDDFEFHYCGASIRLKKCVSAFHLPALRLRRKVGLRHHVSLLSALRGWLLLNPCLFALQGVEQGVSTGLPSGHAYEPCVQLAESFFDLSVLLGW